MNKWIDLNIFVAVAVALSTEVVEAESHVVEAGFDPATYSEADEVVTKAEHLPVQSMVVEGWKPVSLFVPGTDQERPAVPVVVVEDELPKASTTKPKAWTPHRGGLTRDDFRYVGTSAAETTYSFALGLVGLNFAPIVRKLAEMSGPVFGDGVYYGYRCGLYAAESYFGDRRVERYVAITADSVFDTYSWTRSTVSSWVSYVWG